MAGDMNMFATNLEYNEDGVLRPESLEGMDLEDIQEMLEYIADAIRADEKNIEVLREARNKKVFEACAEKKVDTFDLEGHTYTKFPKTKIQGTLLKDRHKLIWKDITTKRCDMLEISKEKMVEYLKSVGLKPAERAEIIKDVTLPYKDEVRVTKH